MKRLGDHSHRRGFKDPRDRRRRNRVFVVSSSRPLSRMTLDER